VVGALAQIQAAYNALGQSLRNSTVTREFLDAYAAAEDGLTPDQRRDALNRANLSRAFLRNYNDPSARERIASDIEHMTQTLVAPAANDPGTAEGGAAWPDSRGVKRTRPDGTVYYERPNKYDRIEDTVAEDATGPESPSQSETEALPPSRSEPVPFSPGPSSSGALPDQRNIPATSSGLVSTNAASLRQSLTPAATTQPTPPPSSAGSGFAYSLPDETTRSPPDIGAATPLRPRDTRNVASRAADDPRFRFDDDRLTSDPAATPTVRAARTDAADAQSGRAIGRIGDLLDAHRRYQENKRKAEEENARSRRQTRSQTKKKRLDPADDPDL